MRVAACQITPAEKIADRKNQLQTILRRAETEGMDFLCLPEGFFTGYYEEEQLARENAMEVGSPLFAEWLTEFRDCSATVIAGFNERHENLIFDSAAIIEQGTLLGIQRKHHLYHNYFSSDSSFSIFHSKGIAFGVTICLDTNYFEPSRLLAMQGAVILFSPMCNLVSSQHPFAVRPPYYSHFVARSFENRCWLVTADWVYPDDGERVCPGHTVIYDPDGKEILRSREMQEDLLVIDIPAERLYADKSLRVQGSAILAKELSRRVNSSLKA